jgi:hypothetical protein
MTNPHRTYPDAAPDGSLVEIGIDEATLLALTNTELDDVFRRAPAGEIPDGNMRGTVLAWPGTVVARPLALLVYLLAWQGKVVSRERHMLRNKITPLRLRLIAARLSHATSWVDGRECVLLDYSRTSLVAHMVRDEIRLVAPDLYLGVVWLWRWRAGWFTLRAPSSPSG